MRPWRGGSGRLAHADGPTRVGSHHTAAAAPSPGQCSPQPAEFSLKRVNTKQSRPAHWHGPQGHGATGTHTAVPVPLHGPEQDFLARMLGLAAPWSWPSGSSTARLGTWQRQASSEAAVGRGCTGPKGPGARSTRASTCSPLVGTESWVQLEHPRQAGRTRLDAGRDRAYPANTHRGERGPCLTWGLTAHLGPCVQRAWWALLA